jgi:hypothetical protein
MKLHAKACAVAAVAAVVALPASGALGGTSSDVKKLRKATDQYHSLAVAKHDGYARLKDAKGIACIDQPGEGAMGVHYVRKSLVGNPAVDLKHPEAVVYEPTRSGALKLVALEWVVIKADWDAKHSSPPRLFGHEFMLMESPNRFGLPAFYMLHAWAWKANPSGMFMPWNPDVTCRYSVEPAA